VPLAHPRSSLVVMRNKVRGTVNRSNSPRSILHGAVRFARASVRSPSQSQSNSLWECEAFT
jgi:hypothetical protein